MRFLNTIDKDKHKGKMAFVLGSGPSLRFLNPEILKPHVTIAVNSAIMKASESDYYFTCDFGMTVWHSWLTLQNLKCQIRLFNVDVGFRHLETLTKQDTFEGIDEHRVAYFDMKESLDMDSYPLIQGSTSTHAAVHFAHFMGCSPIVLLGCDNKYVDDKYHYYDFHGQPHDDYRKDSYRDFKPRINDFNKYLDGHEIVWWELSRWNPGINIIDCSLGTLDMFPQPSLASTLFKYA